MLNPSNIYRSNRRTLSIHVDALGNLIVNAPEKLNDKKIFDFVKSRADWISARQAAVERNNHINRNVATYNAYYFLGRELTPVVSNKAKQITREDGNLLIPARFEPDKIPKKIEKYLRDTAKTIITDRSAYFRQILRLNPTQISTNNNKTRWGCCTRSREIAVNWRAMMLKPALLDYIIVHEFCHLLEFNHTKNFWAVVQTILPNWKSLRAELKHMGWLLQLFR